MTKNELIDLLVRCVKKAEKINLEKLGSNVSSDISFKGFISALEAEREEERPWKPELGEHYFVVSGNGRIYEHTRKDDIGDEAFFSMGNYFRTEEEAEKARMAIKSLLKGRR